MTRPQLRARHPVSLLRRPHDRHRDLRGRLPAPPRADHQDRHVMTLRACNLPQYRAPLPLVIGRPRRRLSATTRSAADRASLAGAIADANAAWRRSLTPSAAQPPLHGAARLNRATRPRRRNPHSTRGTGVPPDSRVPSLEAFGRRPRCLPHRRDGPASETLHKYADPCTAATHVYGLQRCILAMSSTSRRLPPGSAHFRCSSSRIRCWKLEPRLAKLIQPARQVRVGSQFLCLQEKGFGQGSIVDGELQLGSAEHRLHHHAVGA